MGKNGNGLAIFAIIIGLIGAGTGGYLFAKNIVQEAEIVNLKEDITGLEENITDLEEDITDLEDTIEEEPEAIIMPKARVYYDGTTFDIDSPAAHKLIDFTNASYDTHNAFNFTTDLYTVPESGVYQINAQYSIYAIDGDDFVIYIMKNNDYHSFRRYTVAKTVTSFGVGVSDMVNATIGDTISIRCYFSASSAASRLVTGGEFYTFFAIAKLA